MLSTVVRILGAVCAAVLLAAGAHAEPAFQDDFNGGTLGAGWTFYDGYAEQNPEDTANFASYSLTGSHLSIAIPGDEEHNMWWNEHAQVTRPFLGSGIYEIKVDSTFTGAQQFGLIFQGADEGTFLIFMLYSYISDEAKGYVERFSYVDGTQHKQTFYGGGIGRYIPAAGPYYIRVTVDDHPLPQYREWTFEWSDNGATWTTLVSGILEGNVPQQNIGEIQQVGVFAGNQPQTPWPPYAYDSFVGTFDYFRYYEPEQAPLAAPSNFYTRAGDQKVELEWDPVSGADVYAVYSSTTSGGPYTQLTTTLEPGFTHLGATNDVSYYYVVTALASGIEGAATPEVEAVPHALTAYAALPTSGLALALSATELAYTHQDGDPVTYWTTAIGGQSLAIGPEGSRPTFKAAGLNGQPTVRFDGVNDWMSLHGDLEDFSAGVSIYVVAKPTALQFGSKYVLLGNGAGWDGIGVGRAGDTSGYQYFTDSGWGGVGWFNTPNGLVAGQASLLSVIQDAGTPGSSAYAEVAKNGIPLAGGYVYSPPIYPRGTNYLARSYWSDGLFQGDIAEVIVYSRKLSEPEQADVRAYIAVKYGLAIDGYPGIPQPLETPTGLTAVPGDDSVALSWGPITGATGYRVYRSGASLPVTLIAEVGQASYVDDTVANGYTYEYTVTAYDAGSESPHSSAVSVTPMPPAPIAASVPTAGLILALDAATALQDYGTGNGVGVWRDGSGSHHNAIAGGGLPTVVDDALNGHPVLRFDGVDDYLTLPAGFDDFTSGMSLYIVTKPTVLQSGFKLLLLGNGPTEEYVGFGRSGSTSGLQYFTSASSGSVAWFETGGGLQAGEEALFSLVQQGGTPNGFSLAEVGKNGAVLNGQSVYVPPVTSRTTNYIGNSYWTADGKFQGDIAEVLLYDRALDSEEQSAVRAYIGQKYGIVVQ